MPLPAPNSNMSQNKSACWWDMHRTKNWNDHYGTSLNGYIPHANMSHNAADDTHCEVMSSEFQNSIRSILTGPSCWLILYHETNFTGQYLCIGPNSAIRNLKDYSDWADNLKSFRAYRMEPDDWAETKPQNNAISKRFAADQKADSVVHLVGTLASDGLSLIPEAGGVLGPAFDLLWPTGQEDTRVREDMKAWVRMTMFQLGFEIEDIFDDKNIDSLRDGVYSSLSHDSDGNLNLNDQGQPILLVKEFSDLLDTINSIYEGIDGTASESPSGWQANSVHFLAIYSSISALCWSMTRYIDFSELSDDPSQDPTGTIQSSSKNALENRLPELISYIEQGMDAIQNARLAMVKETDKTTKYWHWMDTYTGLHSNVHHLSSAALSGAITDYQQ